MLNVKGALDDETEDPVADHLRRLPLKLSARLSVGTPVISGGHVQRLLSARALMNRPSITFRDGPSIAPDNQGRRHLNDAVVRFDMSGIVIHWLSTTRRADGIRVLSVCEGTKEVLINHSAVSRNLARRQGS